MNLMNSRVLVILLVLLALAAGEGFADGNVPECTFTATSPTNIAEGRQVSYLLSFSNFGNGMVMDNSLLNCGGGANFSTGPNCDNAIFKTGGACDFACSGYTIGAHMAGISLWNGPWSLGEKVYCYGPNQPVTASPVQAPAPPVPEATVPEVRITNPADNSTYGTTAVINLEAAITNAGNTITKVEFYNGDTLIPSPLETPPYRTGTIIPSPGTYIFTAKAYYGANGLLAVTSNPVAITVTSRPIVILMRPNNNTMYAAPSTIQVSAYANDAGGIAKVELYNGENKIGELSSNGTGIFSGAFSQLPHGTSTLTAKAYNTHGVTATSGPITIVVTTPPTISMALSNQEVIVPAGASASILLAATATNPDLTLDRAEFYNGGTIIGEGVPDPDNPSYFTFDWRGVINGVYTLTARAYDTLGTVTASSPVELRVVEPPRELQYSGLGIAQNSGAAEIREKSMNVMMLTVTNMAAGDPKLAQVLVTKAGAFSPQNYLIINNLALDGNQAKTIYLDRADSNSNGICYNDTENITTKEQLLASCTQLRCPSTAGSYSCSVNGSTFIASGFRHTAAIEATVPNQLPTAALAQPANNSSFTAPATIALVANASDPDGAITKVEFYNGDTKLGEDTAAPYEYSWGGVAAGSYSLTAKAYDNDSAGAVSAAVSITVNAPAAVSPPPAQGGDTGGTVTGNFTGGSTGGAVPAGAEAKAGISNIKVSQLEAGKEATITIALKNTSTAQQKFVVQLQAFMDGNEVYSSSLETAIIARNRDFNAQFSNWAPKTPGDYNIIITLYNTTGTKTEQDRKTIMATLAKPAEEKAPATPEPAAGNETAATPPVEPAEGEGNDAAAGQPAAGGITGLAVAAGPLDTGAVAGIVAVIAGIALAAGIAWKAGVIGKSGGAGKKPLWP